MRRRIRADDTRSDELLAAAGRRAYELELAIGWTAGLIGEKAKAASDRGTFAWKRAARLPEAGFAAGLYVERCRTRNPIVTASGSGLVLLEVDGEPDLLEQFGIDLPETVQVASRRGLHFYLHPSEGRSPLKVQVSGEGVVVSGDGYLIGAGALHTSGHVYAYVGDPDVGIAELAAETYERLLVLGGEAQEHVRRTLEAGEALVEGLRRDTLFDRARAGTPRPRRGARHLLPTRAQPAALLASAARSRSPHASARGDRASAAAPIARARAAAARDRGARRDRPTAG
jgi:hypothetical protein